MASSLDCDGVDWYSLSMGLTEAKAMEVIEDLYSTDTVANTLKRHGVPVKSFFRLIASVPSLTDNYTLVHSIRADLFADEMIDIADNSADPMKAKNQIDVRKWVCGKMKPDKYGERIDLTVHQTIDIKAALESANNRLRQVLDISVQSLPVSDKDHYVTQAAESAQIVESTNKSLAELLD